MLTIQRLAGPHQTARLSALKKNAAWRWDKSETFSHYSYPPQHFTSIFLIISDIIGFSAVRASGFSRVGESRIFFENTVRDHEIQKRFTARISSEKSAYILKILIFKSNGRLQTLVTVGTARCPSSSATRPASISSPSPSRRMPTRATTTSMSRFTRSTATRPIAESEFFCETKIWCTTCSLSAFGRWLIHVF